jgi:hypothetical protein
MVRQRFIKLPNIKFNENRFDSCVRWKMITLYVTLATRGLTLLFPPRVETGKGFVMTHRQALITFEVSWAHFVILLWSFRSFCELDEIWFLTLILDMCTWQKYT